MDLPVYKSLMQLPTDILTTKNMNSMGLLFLDLLWQEL